MLRGTIEIGLVRAAPFRIPEAISMSSPNLGASQVPRKSKAFYYSTLVVKYSTNSKALPVLGNLLEKLVRK